MGAGEYQAAGGEAPPSYAPPSYAPGQQQGSYGGQQQASYGATVLSEEHDVHVHVHASSDEQQQAVLINLVILLVGVFFCPVWLAGWMYKDHPDETVRMLAKINLILFFLATAICLCVFGLSIAFFVVWLLFVIIIAIIGAVTVT